MDQTQRKLREAIQACIDGEFYEVDYNGQESGFVELPSGRTLQVARIGDTFRVEATPNSCRDCASGQYVITVLDWINGPGYRKVTVKIEDEMGWIGEYPNFEHFQNYDCSGTYIVTVLVDGSFKINCDHFDLEKVRRRCRDALNKTNDPKKILNVAGVLETKIW